MKIDYVLDTSTVSYFVKGNTNVIDRVMDLPLEQVAVTPITIAEIYYGLIKVGGKLSEEEKTDIRKTTELFLCQDIEAAVALRHAQLKVDAGMDTCKCDNDLWLAAYCDHHQATLVTVDTKLSHLQNFGCAIEIISL